MKESWGVLLVWLREEGAATEAGGWTPFEGPSMGSTSWAGGPGTSGV